ncbi:hypothetical protein ACX122_09920 [Kosakonia cowanii]
MEIIGSDDEKIRSFFLKQWRNKEGESGAVCRFKKNDLFSKGYSGAVDNQVNGEKAVGRCLNLKTFL